MSEIKIDIKRSGFPVKIGDVELWFSTSPESLNGYVEAVRSFPKLEEKMKEKAKEIQLPEEFDENDIQNIDLTMTDKAFELNKEWIGTQYDLIFGKGTFDKLYSIYDDVDALENALDIVGVAINKKLNEIEKDRSKKVESTISEILDKKAKK